MIMFICAYKIHVYLKRQVNLTYVQKKVQQQVSYTLTVQAISQLLAYYGPSASFGVLAMLRINTSFIIKLLYVVYSFVPIVNAVSAFVFITVYRNSLIYMCSQCVYCVGMFVGLKRFVKSIPAWQTKVMANRETAVSNSAF
ncbi:hypothetical protein M3Y97_01090700 [Aphelenchoides bicaudatus]|nr:hypothetical protein M3Y97_01090700 [Aphelenchoides bicaudatus]